jgi:predicted esterase
MPAEGLTETSLKLADFPVLVSVGDSDEMISRNEAEQLASALPIGTLRVLLNTRHPMPKVDTKVFLDIAMPFVTSAENLNRQAKTPR